MTTRELHFYDEEALALRQKLIRRFDNCTVWSAERDGIYFLLLDERARKHTTLCRYTSLAEFEDDQDFLKNQPPGALSGVGAASPAPTPPTREGGNARSFPPEE
jgi:hypothetical protein